MKYSKGHSAKYKCSELVILQRKVLNLGVIIKREQRKLPQIRSYVLVLFVRTCVSYLKSQVNAVIICFKTNA